MAPPPIILADKAYIPRKQVKIARVKKHYERHVYNEKRCAKCDNKPDRFNDICAQCPHHLAFIKTWQKEEIKGKPYIGLPVGDADGIFNNLGIDINNASVKDIRSAVPMSVADDIRFTGKLYDGTQVINKIKTANQRKIIKRFWKRKRGLIEAAPRTGKTAMAVRLITAFKLRTIVFAHERELLKQFLRAVRKFTNIKALEAQTGRKLVGIVQHERDWKENWDIVLVNYQKFISDKGRLRIRKHVHQKFGLSIVDEVHRANAFAYSKVINFIDAKYRMGLTATTERKDGLEFVVQQIMGPVVAKSTVKAMTPSVSIHVTNLKPKYEWKGMTAYVKAVSWAAEHKDRNKMLVRQVFRDLRENPKHCVILPVMRVGQAKFLARMINKQARFNNENRDENWPDDLAMPLYDGVDRDEVFRKARDGSETRVVVSIIKMCKEGTDVPTWTHMYLQFPMNNAPMFYQLYQRICTPYEGKPDPVLRMYIDDFGLSKGCFTGTWFGGVKKYGINVSEVEEGKAQAVIQSNKKPGRYGGPPLKSIW